MSIEIASLGQKLDKLLELTGRTHGWLARSLNVTPPAVSNWRKANRIPATQARVTCRLLGIDLPLLQEPDLARFTAALENSFALGSGKHWERLLRAAEESPAGLLLQTEIQTPRPQPLAGVDYERDFTVKAARLPQFRIGEQVRFTVTDVAVPADFSPVDFTLCVEDPLGWRSLCPRRDQPGFARYVQGWQLPPRDRAPLNINEPVGTHLALAVLLGQPLPREISSQFHKTEWACDALAAWIAHDAVPHRALKRRFNVIAG